MTVYNAPLKDLQFIYKEMGILEQLQGLPGCEEVTADLLDAVLDEASKLATDVIAPTNGPGDRQGAQWDNGVVRVPDGFEEAYKAYVEGGWNSVPFEPDYGGQGLPWALSSSIQEMWQSANLAWALCPLLNQGAVEAITAHASDDLKAQYLEKMISGEWSGTMNLTEPQAGSDLSLVKSRAERDGDHYRIKGQKIFITYGEHEMTGNIIHLVLARLPDAPEGVKGISLFLVPKFLLNNDGTPGERNDLRCVSIEHKLGIHGSPTCVMSYGDNEGAIGYLVGEENKGLACMFTMMNNARLAVGQQGLSVAERAYQQAADFARERRQGRGHDPKAGAAPIIEHADVRRMLMTMRAYTEAMRAVITDTMCLMDISKRHGEESWYAWATRRVGLMTPVIKGWFTDLAVELTSMGVQVHGGMGFIEETGAAQHFRDSRILPIYEGTNGIQAMDLVGRKIMFDDGKALDEYLDEAHSFINRLNGLSNDDIAVIRKYLAAGIDTLEQAGDWLLEEGKKDPDAAGGAAAYLLRLFGTVAGGIMLAKAAVVACAKLESGEGDQKFYAAKLATARFYAENVLSQAPALLIPITEGHKTLAAIDEEIL
ncbi:acyl-CoA dehydrogenase [Aestuariispira insulae]|uniref:3-methylmercaptopropionyl-CoA dehydrogenase n=1 Tax=Aestuariispira insulae TaxID=1461337 RepID=A0A3D9HRY7_9PROT|nr:acyl-CoA dehydrogenase [Aestuariispira insulae]RED52230.1 alkylation response protein AidB-like acyl-CoA dehydrogenase [Aestuariispira insulae]